MICMKNNLSPQMDHCLQMEGLWEEIEQMHLLKGVAGFYQCCEIARERCGIARDIDQTGCVCGCNQVAGLSADAGTRRVHDNQVRIDELALRLLSLCLKKVQCCFCYRVML